jgi:hypothetical protein
MYRRALAASWHSQPGELPADEVIEDIFSGGDGWKPIFSSKSRGPGPDGEDSASLSDEAMRGTLRPSDVRRMNRTHRRHHSGASDKSVVTVTGRDGNGHSHSHGHGHGRNGHRRNASREDVARVGQDGTRSRSESLTSLAPTMGSSDRGRDVGFRRTREVDESEVRDDLIAWKLPEAC